MLTKGYTLIEILVAVSIFFVVIAAPSGFFVTALKGQQKALASQELLDNASYALEYMSRSLRMAKKDDVDGVNCLLAYKLNYATTTQGIKFRNYEDKCQEFYLEDGRIKENKTGYAQPLFLTSNDLEVSKFEISITGETQKDIIQPRITLLLEAKGNRPAIASLQPVLRIQTTISQRNLDVQY
jgi:prepilin-type N-terminal cleavage/methylation domain-containing protein